ncbi:MULTISPECIES: DUF817 domain-containing protein [Sphingobium]|uniref:Integral membrane protein n=1 Tax=Sphingobium yanoikuyae ATCC 51230 TaxID=883163 RepID=K9D7K2_SPHYA|nr:MULTISPECIES: DUF817 domain-containing protein [Sphingobium]EKU73515.1 hypothetical protein HMPREF9718_03984 [Sphingobium yanoikuyae ATCC 51230]WQE08291.1 DUF817 domain-containing protein [Sphingobium yanoikuyae]SHM07734.1 Uncharacterized membrane protein YoaT, DUF817 family [Sphingobium sp. YR657]
MNDPTGATRFARIRAHLESVRVAAGPRAWAYEFLLFGFKQGWACLFGGLMLALLLATHLFYPAGAPLHRYDFLTLSAIAIQIAMLALRLESPREALVICAFHLIGTIMELFKTHAGSWVYPEASLLHIGPVPLFSGFMYAAVGSYIARVWRIFDFGFSRYPPAWTTVLLASAIYVNFFAHHWLPDVRIALFAAAILLFGRSWIWFTPWREPRRMPLLLGFFLVALFIWLAENIGTFANAWTYPSQRHGWEMVSLMKLGAWYLLMIISFVLVSLIHGIRRVDQIR